MRSDLCLEAWFIGGKCFQIYKMLETTTTIETCKMLETTTTTATTLPPQPTLLPQYFSIGKMGAD